MIGEAGPSIGGALILALLREVASKQHANTTR